MTENSLAVRGALATVDDQTLSELKSVDDVMALLAAQGIEVTDISDYGDGFQGVEKEVLVNLPFILLDYSLNPSKTHTDDNGKPLVFAVVRAYTSDGRKVRFADGSTGVCAQLIDLNNRGVKGGVRCPKGLTVSEYEIEDPNNPKKKIGAKTYYLGE